MTIPILILLVLLAALFILFVIVNYSTEENSIAPVIPIGLLVGLLLGAALADWHHKGATKIVLVAPEQPTTQPAEASQ